MRFNHYIVLSILSHLLLLGFFAVAHPAPEIVVSIFDVEIIGPLEIPTSPPKKTLKPRITKKRSSVKYRYPKPHLPELLPETIQAEETESTTQTAADLDNSGELKSPGNHISLAEDDRFLSSKPEEDGSLSSGEDELSSVPWSSLFDKETIERFARKSLSREKNLTFDTSEFKHRGYMRMLKQRIESIWKYPREAARRGISGDLYVRFVIKKDGRLGDVELLRTSGYRYLDKAAIKAVKDAGPFWPLPEDWENDDLEIKGYFIYILGSTYVM